jgi:hypothetical protein
MSELIRVRNVRKPSSSIGQSFWVIIPAHCSDEWPQGSLSAAGQHIVTALRPANHGHSCLTTSHLWSSCPLPHNCRTSLFPLARGHPGIIWNWIETVDRPLLLTTGRSCYSLRAITGCLSTATTAHQQKNGKILLNGMERLPSRYSTSALTAMWRMEMFYARSSTCPEVSTRTSHILYLHLPRSLVVHHLSNTPSLHLHQYLASHPHLARSILPLHTSTLLRPLR